jgi:hypothetical protein
MKRPYKPAEPRKPQAPSKILKIRNTIPINGRNTLDSILARIPVGSDPKEIYLVEDTYDDYTSYNYDPCTTTEVYVEYYIEQPNTRYDIEKAAYDKKVKEYQKKLEAYKPKFEAFIKAKEEYDNWFSTSVEENRKLRDKKELEALRKKVKQLEKKIQK